MHYVWQGVIVAISRRIRDVKIAVNSSYVCQGTKGTAVARRERFMVDHRS